LPELLENQPSARSDTGHQTLYFGHNVDRMAIFVKELCRINQIAYTRIGLKIGQMTQSTYIGQSIGQFFLIERNSIVLS